MSNKYRLIKTYPGSPKLDTICKYDKNPWSDSNAFTNPVLNPKYYPEFWQPVVEKDYEILSLISTRIDKIIITYKDGGGVYEPKFFENVYKSIDHWVACFTMNNNPWQIHSVKRKDGEVFTIGDKYNWKSNKNRINIIRQILLEDGKILIHDSEYISEEYDADLDQIEKVKQPLFTTEQRSEIEEIIKNIIK